MYISEHNTIALTHERISDLHRDAAKIRLEHEARGDRETTTGRRFSFFSILRRAVPVQPQVAAEPAVRTATLRHA